eukprot:TRINITY_DN904_c0_g1_i1.p1 TRINITY_DN904_c0_g1~~TRINITY_DN904_c0_g1_i1.p1  ORF type:complete len:718 (-),score=95.06 TRINITY_DN904_c0_g1_i1:454-2607(-)
MFNNKNQTGTPNNQQQDYSVSPDWHNLEQELNKLTQDDLPQLGSYIPNRASTAPPQLIQPQLIGGLVGNSPMPVKEDIRYDDQYAQFYREYQGSQKLPPPIEEDQVMQELYSKAQAQMNQNAVLMAQQFGQQFGGQLLNQMAVAAALGQERANMNRTPSVQETLQQLNQLSINGGSPMPSNPATPAPDLQSVVYQMASQIANQGNANPGTPPPLNAVSPPPGNLQVAQNMNGGVGLNSDQQQQLGSVLSGPPMMGMQQAPMDFQQWQNLAYGLGNVPFAQQMPALQQMAAAQNQVGMNNGLNTLALAALSAMQQGKENAQQLNQPVLQTSGGSGSELLEASRRTGNVSTRVGNNKNDKAGKWRGRDKNSANGAPSRDPQEDPLQYYMEHYKSVDDVVGHVMEIAKDQYGCRYLQKLMDEGGAETVARLFPEILERARDMMMDPFGNYLIQKMLEECNEEQRTAVLRKVTADGQLVRVALNTHGTRAVQKVLETLRTPEQIQMVIETFKPGVVDLIMDLNGNHVVQKCLQKLGPDMSQFIYDAACERVQEIAKHRHGCCVLQRCIDFATQRQKQMLVECIAKVVLDLSQDQYGNYVVQYILDMGNPEASRKVMEGLQGSYVMLSKQKFSSNVVEKCLKLNQVGLEKHRDVMIVEITESVDLLSMLQDPYGNYVVQSALQVTTGELHNRLVDAIKPHVPNLKNTPQGKRIVQRINGKLQ